MQATEYRPELRDHARALWRRRYPALAALVAVLSLAVVAAVLWPPVYRSTATILIEEQEIPQDLVRTTISSYADQRIQVISQQVMTRANLMQIVQKYDLYTKERRTETTEEILARMRRDIKLDLVNSDVTDRRSGGRTSATIAFTLSFENRFPDRAQKVATELTSLYLNENLQIRKQKAGETSQFLAREAEQLGGLIAQIDAKLAEFKKRHQGRTPDLTQINWQMRDRADTELLDIERTLASIEERRFYIDAQLAQIKPNTYIVSRSGEDIVDPVENLRGLRAQYAAMEGLFSRDHPDMKRLRRQIEALEKESAGADVGERSRALSELKADLVELRTRLAEAHPDVVKLKATIAALERVRPVSGQGESAQIERTRQELTRLRERHGDNHVEVTRVRSILSNLEKQAESTQRGSRDARGLRADNPAYLLLQAQIEALNTEERATKIRRAELKARLAELDARLEKSPEVEREYLELARDRENTVVRYREIKAKLMTAEVAQELEQARKSERFSLIDPAQQPEKPKSPDRAAIVLMGAVLSLLAGLGIAALLELLDGSVRNSRHLGSLMPVPVLSAIPYVVNVGDARRTRRIRLSVLFAIAAGVPVIAVLVHLAWMPLDVLWYSALRRIENYAFWPR